MILLWGLTLNPTPCYLYFYYWHLQHNRAYQIIRPECSYHNLACRVLLSSYSKLADFHVNWYMGRAISLQYPSEWINHSFLAHSHWEINKSRTLKSWVWSSAFFFFFFPVHWMRAFTFSFQLFINYSPLFHYLSVVALIQFYESRLIPWMLPFTSLTPSPT